MPLYATKHINNQSILAVWRIEETLDELYQRVYLSESDNTIFATLKAEKRKKEWLTSRLLLQLMLEEKLSISYEITGKPYIFNSDWDISISHKNEFVAIILGKNKQVAVDIEKLSTRLDNVYDYFMSEEEMKNLDRNHQNLQLHLHWCAKECLIKLANKKNLKLIEDIRVYPIHPRLSVFEAEVRDMEIMTSYNFHYEMLSHDYVIVWTADRTKNLIPLPAQATPPTIRK